MEEIVYLKALEIQGFKSFPEKTVLTFEKEITAIVGPNGSGKSNISDALLWVMGEQRSRALRGGKMEDVIFGGTEKRSAMGFAEVTLIMDNSFGFFHCDTPEVAITRRYYRSGESEYFLNRESVRLKDITELLMDTGLGRDGYSVIGQGRIAEIVSAKSTDRREVFEEAAGISRFRYRKEEAERKIQRTEENLLRINDKIDELEIQVGPLQKQAETAKKFLILRDEQRLLDISVWMETLDRLQEKSGEVHAAYEHAKITLDEAQKELANIYAAGEELSERMRNYDIESESVRELLTADESAAAECDSAAAVLRTNLRYNEESISRLQSEMEEQYGRTENLRVQAETQEQRLEEIAALLTAKNGEIRAVQQESEHSASVADEAQRGLAALVTRENRTGDSITKCATTLSLLQDRAAELESRNGSIDTEINAAIDRCSELKKAIREARDRFNTAKELVDELDNILNGHKMLLGSREMAVRDLTAELNTLTVEKRSAEARAHMLSEMEKEYEGMGRAVKSVMQAASRGILKGVHGPIAGLITVENRYAVAIETALGAAMQHIVVDSQDCGKAALEMLKRTDGGRATFQPIDTIRSGGLQWIPKGEQGFLGVANSLVRYDSRYSSIIDDLLGRTIVADSLSDAVAMSKKSKNKLRIVTLDGQMIHPGGSMTGGSAARNVGILSRANELKSLRLRLAELSESERDCSDRLSEAERVLAGAKYEAEVAANERNEAGEALHSTETELSRCQLMLETAEKSLDSLENEREGLSAILKENQRRMDETALEQQQLVKTLEDIRAEIRDATDGQHEYTKQRDSLNEKMASLRAECAALETESDALRRSAESLRAMLLDLSGDSDERKKSIDVLTLRNGELQTELQASLERATVLRDQADERRRRIADITAARMDTDGRRTQNNRLSQEKNRELMDLQADCTRLEQKKISVEMEQTQIVDKLWDSYELSRTAAQTIRQPVDNMSAATKRIAELRREISRLGPVNLGAVDEYERVKERYDFLTGQRDDVESAKRDLLKIVSDVTMEMREIFVREFAAIDESFRQVFLELFGGGKAALLLEDPDDPLGCGIEIQVQPPGKAVTTISLLSGGEKSFVAIALYFAIMKVRPTPFCVMDEIDAALDDANVERYAEYLRSMSSKTQFIVITHHRGTMEEAEVLYGVTMQEKGVSTVLNIDLDEAERSIS